PPQTPHPPEPHPRIPTTPWRHTRHWLTSTAAGHQKAGTQPLPAIDEDEVDITVLQSPVGAAERTGRLFTLEWEAAALDKDKKDKEAGSLEGLLLVGERADADPLLAGLHSSLCEQIGQCELVPADDQEGLREAISRTDVVWDAVVVVCPPRAV